MAEEKENKRRKEKKRIISENRQVLRQHLELNVQFPWAVGFYRLMGS